MNRRKRKYTRVFTKETETAIWDRLKIVEYQFRIGYLLTLRPGDMIDELIEFNFRDVTGPQSDFVRNQCRLRTVGVAGTWQHRCLEKIIVRHRLLR